MANVVEAPTGADAALFAGLTEKYRFTIIANFKAANAKAEATPMDIPSQTKGFIFDGKSQTRSVSFDFYILPTTYTIAGTGEILTQQEDLDYLHRNQVDILTAAGVTTWTLALRYPAAMDHAPEDALNEGGVVSGSVTKVFYVSLDKATFPRNAGELYMIVPVEAVECDEVFGL